MIDHEVRMYRDKSLRDIEHSFLNEKHIDKSNAYYVDRWLHERCECIRREHVIRTFLPVMRRNRRSWGPISLLCIKHEDHELSKCIMSCEVLGVPV